MACLASACTSDRSEVNKEPAELARTADHTYSTGGAREFRTVGELVATADVVVYGRVTAVERGPTHTPDDGTGISTTTRILVVEVQERLFERRNQEVPDSIRISDGYWQDGVGYESEALGWAEPGHEGYFFVERAEDSEATDAYYDLVSDSGRVIVTRDGVIYAPDSVWDNADQPVRDRADLQYLVGSGVRDAQSGTAQPVDVLVCEPSTPGDENSEPVCVKE